MSENTKIESVELLAKSTIAEVLAQRITETSTSPKMLEIIDKRIEKCLTDVIDDAFSSWGDFSKATKEAFKAALPGNIDNVIDLQRYNAMIEQRLRDMFASSGIANNLIERAEGVLSEAMNEKLMPPVIMLSDFIEAFMLAHRREASEENWERPDLRVKEPDGAYFSDYRYFYFDKCKEASSRYSSDKSDYQLANHLSMSPVEGEQIDGSQVYEVYAAKIEDKFVQHILTTRPIRDDWEKMVFAMYYGQSKICIDCDVDDYYYPSNDY